MSERVPRASISARFLDDEDVIGLLGSGDAGARAVFMYVQLLILAKQIENNGHFKGKIERYAARLTLTPARARALWNMLVQASETNGNEPWMFETDAGFDIRSWKNYNEERTHGGARRGAGRPRKNGGEDISSAISSTEVEYSNEDANEISTEQKEDSKRGATVTVTVTDTSHSAHPPRELSPPVPDFSGPLSRASESGQGQVDARQRETIGAALARYKIGGVAARTFARDPRVTPALLDELAADIGSDVANGSGVLIRLVCDRLGITLPSRGKGTGDAVADSLAKLRRTKGAPA